MVKTFDPPSELRIYRDGGDYFVTVGYKVNLDGEDPIVRDRRFGPLAGTAKTRTENIFASVDAAISSKEGL